MSPSPLPPSPPATGKADRPLPAGWRWLLLAAGFVCVALGVLGVFLPLLPTTPFLLVAAACFARSSPRFHAWLLANRTFGPLIYQWESKRTIPRKTKWIAIAMMVFTLGTSILFFVKPLWLKALLAAFGLGLALWMWRIPSPPPDESERARP